MLYQILTDFGFTNVITYSTGEECVKNLHLNPFIVFLDYQMEEMNGIEVLKKIKFHYPGIGVVFCTAHEDLSVAVNAIEHGSYEYLLKSNANIKEVGNIIETISKRNNFLSA